MAKAMSERTSAEPSSASNSDAGTAASKQQWREGQPVAEDLGRGDRFLGEAAQRELVEHAVGAVGLDQPLDRQQGGGQRGDPQRAAADAGEQAGVGADGKRHDRRDQQKEGDRQPGGPGERMANFAGDERAHHGASSSRRQSPASAPCVAARTAPPALR